MANIDQSNRLVSSANQIAHEDTAWWCWIWWRFSLVWMLTLGLTLANCNWRKSTPVRSTKSTHKMTTKNISELFQWIVKDYAPLSRWPLSDSEGLTTHTHFGTLRYSYLLYLSLWFLSWKLCKTAYIHSGKMRWSQDRWSQDRCDAAISDRRTWQQLVIFETQSLILQKWVEFVSRFRPPAKVAFEWLEWWRPYEFNLQKLLSWN